LSLLLFLLLFFRILFFNCYFSFAVHFFVHACFCCLLFVYTKKMLLSDPFESEPDGGGMSEYEPAGIDA
jgi:hypothetical protein